MEPDDSIPRNKWSEKRDIPASTWRSDNVLKFSEKERAARAERGARITAEHERDNPLPNVAVDDATAAYLQRMKAINDKHLKLGVKGVPVFSKLSYFRCGKI